jgi:hypothetical protein
VRTSQNPAASREHLGQARRYAAGCSPSHRAVTGGPCSGRAACEHFRGTGDDIRGQLGERIIVIARVSPQHDERLVGGHPHPFGEDSLSLLDNDAAVQGHLQLPRDQSLLAGGAFLQDPDGRHIDQRPGRPRQGKVLGRFAIPW